MSLQALESTINGAFDARDGISTSTKGEVREAVDFLRYYAAQARKDRDLRTYSTARLLSPDAALLEATGASPPRSRAEAHERLAQPLLSRRSRQPHRKVGAAARRPARCGATRRACWSATSCSVRP